MAFHVPFWLSHILVYLFYFCPSYDISIINIQSYGLDRKGHGTAVFVIGTFLLCSQLGNFAVL